MEKYFKRTIVSDLTSTTKRSKTSSEKSVPEIDLTNLPADPGLRIRIIDYDPNIRETVRRAYLQKGPCQPRNHDFLTSQFGKKQRRFNSAWFDEYSNWLEYSISNNAAYCLCCYLFKPNIGEQGGGDSFVGKGFSNWKKKESFYVHVGGSNSHHNQAWQKCEALMNQKQQIDVLFCKQTNEARIHYRVRLGASIDCIRFLLRQGLAFRGHDESETSSNQGNFLQLLQWLCDHNEGIKVVSLKNAPENHKLTSPAIQKEIVSAISIEITNVIFADIGNSQFSILIDESRDLASKEQMAIVVRYVDKKDCVIERFVGIEHVTETTSHTLKNTIDAFFCRHNLSLFQLRGQGYDGASNMRGEFNSLKKLILDENKHAFYIHCFAHQLQLALVVVAENHVDIAGLFTYVSNVVNVVGGSAKRRDILREKHATSIFEELENGELFSGELFSGQGLNQEISLKRPGDTRWNSYYNSLLNLIAMFSSIIEVLEIITESGGSSSNKKHEVIVILDIIQSFNFSFCLHLMRAILGISNELSQALQRKDQDIVNAMKCVKICKERLQTMRNCGWDSLLDEVSTFCNKHHISIPNMSDIFIARGRSRRKVQEITNLHYYRVGLFYTVIDMQLQELNNRFNETNTELLLCMVCLNPKNNFLAFDKQKLVRLGQIYDKDFSKIELMKLEDQLENYIMDVRSSIDFSTLNGVSDLAQKMVETKKDQVYPLVYLLMKLTLILPIVTATVERVFSAMKIVKNRLRNRMEDQWLNDNLVTYIEKDVFDNIDNDVIMRRFQNMKTRRELL